MQIPHSVAKTIKEIDKKIAALEETKRRLVEAFAVQQEQPRQHRRSTVAADAVLVRPIAPSGGGETSAQKLEDFLRSRGAATRKEIMESAGIPRGSVSYLLNMWADRGRARKREDDKWELVA